jgi:hypothetical protein
MPLMLPGESDEGRKEPFGINVNNMPIGEYKDGRVVKGKQLQRSELFAYELYLCML